MNGRKLLIPLLLYSFASISASAVFADGLIEQGYGGMGFKRAPRGQDSGTFDAKVLAYTRSEAIYVRVLNTGQHWRIYVDKPVSLEGEGAYDEGSVVRVSYNDLRFHHGMRDYPYAQATKIKVMSRAEKKPPSFAEKAGQNIATIAMWIVAIIIILLAMGSLFSWAGG